MLVFKHIKIGIICFNFEAVLKLKTAFFAEKFIICLDVGINLY